MRLTKTAVGVIFLSAIFNDSYAAYDWSLDSLSVSGGAVFSDDFNDGDRSSLPTSALIDVIGTTTEAGGFLRLTDVDGTGPSFFFPSDFVMDQANLASPFIDTNDVGTIVQANFMPAGRASGWP